MLSIRHAVPLICAAALIACADAAGPLAPPPPSAGETGVSGSLIAGSESSASLSLPELETEFLPGIPVLDPFAEQLDGDGVVEWARGGGHTTFLGQRRTFAFTAKYNSDGTTKGQFQLNPRALVKEHGVVTCLDVEGKDAFVGGVVTHSDDGTEGTSRVWRVVDNGEGSSNRTDMMTLAVGLLVSGEQICRIPAARRLLAPGPIDDGNIQVTDAPAGVLQ
jgi:hypothetical protein